MSSKEDQIIDGNVVKETPSQSRRFEDGHPQMADPLESGNVGTAPEKLKQAHVVFNAEQESQGYQGDQQQIQGKRQPRMTEKGREYCLSTLENKHAKLVSRLLRKSSKIDDLMYLY